MTSYHAKQHRRIVLLTGVLFCMAVLSIWQQRASLLDWSNASSFGPDSTFYTSSVAFFVSIVAALILVRNSSDEMADVAKLAFIDDLTGLANRRQFDARLNQELSERVQKGGKIAVLYFDLDRFKEINDCYGHEAGDKAIAEFGKRVQSVLRTEDLAARLAGDEFAAIITRVETTNDVVEVAERLLELMREPIKFSHTYLHNKTSIGATIIQDSNVTAVEVNRQADFALLQAKSAGRNRLQIFDPQMAKGLKERREMERDLRAAMVKKEFFVEYQPLIVDGHEQPTGVEALVRWKHPSRGSVSPLEFISIAEQSGIIHELGEFVLRQACSEFKDFGTMKLAVNVSPIQFRHADFIEKLRSILEETGFEPERLELEITESIFISNPARTEEIIKKIRSLGVKIALDDFGTCYSSMSYLQDFSLDRIKIDRSFTRGIERSTEAESLVATMITLGSSLGLAVTVEGVETKEQLQKIKKNSATELQGYFFSRPVTIGDLKKLCRENLETVNTKNCDQVNPQFAAAE